MLYNGRIVWVLKFVFNYKFSNLRVNFSFILKKKKKKIWKKNYKTKAKGIQGDFEKIS